MVLTKIKTRPHYQRLLLGAASATALMGSLAQAQEVESAKEREEKAKESIEVIEVSGFRGSVTRALNAKRFSNNVSDSISAEDVGKSTDQNIADALQRITGVSIQREGGEGTEISVRGAGPDLNRITLNGVELTSTGESNAVDLSQFSSDVLSSIEVVKTPSADHDEGSLGATVILRTFKPLNANKNRRSFEVQARENSFADKEGGPDYKIGGSISEKFLDETLGLSIVASRETQTLREDRYDNTWWRPLTVRNRVGDPDIPGDGNLAGAATNYQTGELVTEWDYNGDGVIEDAEKQIRGYANRQNRYSYNLRERDRDTLNTTLQWQPSENTDIQLDLTYSKQETGLDQNFLTNTTNPNANEAENILWDPETFTFLKWTDTSNRIANNQGNPIAEPTVTVRNHRDIAETVQTNNVAGLQIEHILNDTVTLTLRGGHSESEQVDDLFLRTRFGSINGVRGTGITTGYDCTLSPDLERCDQIITSGDDNSVVDNTDNFQFNVFDVRDRSILDTSNSVYFDVDWDVEFGPITQIETGLKWNNRVKKNKESLDTLNANRVDLPADLRSLTLYHTGEYSKSDWGKEFGFQPSDVTDGWPLADTRAMANAILSAGTDLDATINLANTREIEQSIYAAYIKANFSFFDDRLSGDIGARYAKTEVKASGFTGFRHVTTGFTTTQENIDYFGSEEAALAALGMDVNDNNTGVVPVNATNDYNNFLPSLNLNYLLTEDTIIRFAASKTLARPPIDELKPGFTVREADFSSVSNGTIGATHLKPFFSTNLDLSFEWYFKDDSLFAVTLFDKDFSDFQESAGSLNYWKDVRSTFYDANGDALSDEELAENGTVINVDDILTPIIFDQPSDCLPNREQDLSAALGAEGCDIADLTSSRNGQGGYVRGAEFNFQHGFTYLPGIFSGLGVLANYTYSDSETDAEQEFNSEGVLIRDIPAAPLEGTSEHTYNMTVYWEKDGSLVRLAYNARSDYLEQRLERDGTTEWVEGNDSLDLSATWKINKNFSLLFQATNLTDSVTRRFLTLRGDSVLLEDGSPLIPAESFDLGNLNTSRTSRLTNTGTNYRLSIRADF
ncbi:TonB-dependent receptor [Thalassotalea sp. PLHSN55]|uniref:TonB-dependent receptor n=1 Tax=Thalassotalea sp. PLHSN55 TaxID=3435888 RepID=UPI003F83A95A